MFMRTKISIVLFTLIFACCAAAAAFAQETTAEPPSTETVTAPAAEVTAEPTAEVTAQSTAEPTSAATAEATVTMEVTPEVTPEMTSLPTDTSGYLRIANFAPDVSAVDVSLNDNTAYENVKSRRQPVDRLIPAHSQSTSRRAVKRRAIHC